MAGRGGRKWLGIGCVGIAVLSLAAVWWTWPREYLLMREARPIVNVDPAHESVGWLSNDRAVIVRTDSEAYSSVDSQGRYMSLWSGNADVLDIVTGDRMRLTGLTDCLRRTPDPFTCPLRVLSSPGGTWLLWQYSKLPMSCAVHLDGSHYRDWYGSISEESFFLNDRHFVQMAEHLAPMVVRDLQNPDEDRYYPEPAGAKPVLATFAQQQPLLTVVSPTGDDNPEDLVEIKSYRTEDRLQMYLAKRDGTRKGPQPVQVHSVKLPANSQIMSVTVSPQQQCVLYQLRTVQIDPLLMHLHRFITKIPVKPVVTEALWISRADGRGMREIGHVPSSLSAEDNDEYQLEWLQWLPSGRQVSFVYHGKLYLVSTETPK